MFNSEAFKTNPVSTLFYTDTTGFNIISNFDLTFIKLAIAPSKDICSERVRDAFISAAKSNPIEKYKIKSHKQDLRIRKEFWSFEIAFLTECCANAVARNDRNALVCVSPDRLIYEIINPHYKNNF